MLKGKAIIELTDVHTGEKEVIEENNMVTNALNEIFNSSGIFLNTENLINKSFFIDNFMSGESFVKQFLGGLILFDSAIEENVNTVFAPLSAKPVGYAVYNAQNSHNVKERGTYNINESEYNASQKYMKFVYDFNTSQANGNIACLCLTSIHGGYCSYGAESASYFTTEEGKRSQLKFPISGKTIYASLIGYVFSSSLNSSYETLFLTDVDNNLGYFFKVLSANSISIVKKDLGLKNINLFGSFLNQSVVNETIITLDENVFTDMSDSNLFKCTKACYDKKTNKTSFIFSTYYSYSSSSSSGNVRGSIFVLEVDMDNFTKRNFYKIENLTNLTGESNLSATQERLYVYNGYLYITVNSNIYYSTISKNVKTFKINIKNTADVVELEMMGPKTYVSSNSTYNYCVDYKAFEIDGRIYCVDTHQKNTIFVIDTDANKIYKTELTSLSWYSSAYYVREIVKDKNRQVVVLDAGSTSSSDYSSYYRYFSALSNYLATINNLETPVVKTADKTMKITYIIQDEEAAQTTVAEGQDSEG